MPPIHGDLGDGLLVVMVLLLSGWWFQASWKTWKSMGRMTSHILWKIKHVPNHQPVTVLLGIPIHLVHSTLIRLPVPWCSRRCPLPGAKVSTKPRSSCNGFPGPFWAGKIYRTHGKIMEIGWQRLPRKHPIEAMKNHWVIPSQWFLMMISRKNLFHCFWHILAPVMLK